MVRELTPDRESLKVISWEELLLSGDFREQYERYRDCQAEEICRVTGRTMSEATEIINRGFAAYTSFAKGSASAKMGLRISRIIRLLPGLLCLALRRGRCLRILKSPRETLRAIENERDALSIDKLLDGKCPFSREFLAIHECIIGHWSQNRRVPSDGITEG
jgi:hypothetical protein